MVAIMGGSGCGKTTFLNVLCGKANYGEAPHSRKPLVLAQASSTGNTLRLARMIVQGQCLAMSKSIRMRRRYS